MAQLATLDSERASQLSRNDWYRLHRALVVALQTRSESPAAAPPPAALDGIDTLRASLDMRCFFLAAPREPLCRRIDARCEVMLREGLLEEVTGLLLQRRLLPSSPAGRAIGYRQTLDYLLRTPYVPADGEVRAARHAVSVSARLSREPGTRRTAALLRTPHLARSVCRADSCAWRRPAPGAALVC